MARSIRRVKLSGEDIRRLKRPQKPPEGVAPPEDPGGVSGAERAAREFLRDLAQLSLEPVVRSMRADVGLPGIAPPGFDAPQPAGQQLVKRGERTESLTATDLVSFEQVKNEVPVFGSRVVVEVDARREVVSASLGLAPVDDVDTTPAIPAEKASVLLANRLGLDDSRDLPEPVLTILPHPHEDGAIHLTWRFHNVPFAEPAGEDEHELEADLGGCGAGGRMLVPDFDYFVDAHDGRVIYLFPNSAHLDVPTRCRGVDEEGQSQVFFGRVGGPGFLMENPFEDVRTLDLGLQPIETAPLPASSIGRATSDWEDSNPAAVSAHVNATRVLDFLFRVLRRNSIDDEGMALENVVHCASQGAPNPPEWINAVWWQNRMWYGQQALPGGGFRSLSRFLDVIAHELFHGVTGHTADLVYEGQSGALNESFSDLFGVIVRNWHLASVPGDVGTWSWEIGPGLGANGNPLRDMANPASVGRWWRPNPAGAGSIQMDGYPAHMNDYVALPVTRSYDWGGVHWYSNIHNLAAHNVLTTRRNDGAAVFSPEEVAILYYLCLTRLDRLSNFSDARAELLAVSDTVYAGNPTRQAEARAALVAAYDAVGIA